MPSDARKLSDWLSRPDGLRQALARTHHLAQINQSFRSWLAEPWADAVRIVSLTGESAVFYAANASVSTQLRYRSPAIVAWLQEHIDSQCTRIQISVRPGTYAAN
jgi:hypothetical protein